MIVPRAFQHRYGVTSSSPERSNPNGRSQKSRPERAPTAWRPEPLSRATTSQPILIQTRPSVRRKYTRSSRDTLRPTPTSQPSGTCDVPTRSRARKASTGSVFALDEDTERVGVHRTSLNSIGRIPRHHSTQPLSTSSPQSWELLQTPFNNIGLEDDGGSFDSDVTESPFSTPCSFSSVSLDFAESEKGRFVPSSNKSDPTYRRPRQKSLSSSYTEDCGPNHPLSRKAEANTIPEEPAVIVLQGRDPINETIITEQKSFLASNLSASIRVLKSAAKSFSGLSAARGQQLTRSILSISPQYTDEKRPALYDEVPEPALRRYLNPCHVSPSEFHFHTSMHSAARRCTISIQLQSYYRPPSPSKYATTPAIFPGGIRSLEEEASLPESSMLVRPREPRENGDFLRIIVLEMNMRKAGKLGDAALGKARIWLPPRQASSQTSTTLINSVPERWVGVVT